MTEAAEPPIPKAKVPEPEKPRRFAWVFKILTWLATAACFYLVYTKVDAAAAAEQLTANGARVLGDGTPKTGAHGKPVLFLHPKDFNETLIKLEQF